MFNTLLAFGLACILFGVAIIVHPTHIFHITRFTQSLLVLLGYTSFFIIILDKVDGNFSEEIELLLVFFLENPTD